MRYQLRRQSVFNDFISNKECVIDFLENLGIPELDMKDFDNLECEMFADNDIVKCRNRDDVDGFVIKGNTTQVYVITPEYDYIKFWNARNFFTFTLARHFKNSHEKRYLVNISSKEFKNSLVKFDISPNFMIWNVYEKNENLQNWINALFY